MSRLMDSRDALTTALEAGGLAVAVTAKFAAPCVLVEPGDPWAGVDLSMGRKRTAHWRLTLVAGKADSAGNHERLAELVDQTDAALLTLAGIQLPQWGRPFDATLAGAAYGATQATVQVLTAED